MNKILGIDPGSRLMGYGIVATDGNTERYIASGCIRLDSNLPFIERIGQIQPALSAIITKYMPNTVAIEEVFFAKNAASALKLGQARGAALSAVHQHGLAIYEYSARAIKLALVGKGSANKSQVSFMVQHRLLLNGIPQVDAGDALAVALCHVQHAQITDGA